MRALWSDRPICSHNVSQKVKRIRRVSDHFRLFFAVFAPGPGGPGSAFSFFFFFLERLGKNLAPYRIGKRPHKQNRGKIHQKYRTSYFLVFLMYFWATLKVAVFSYPVGGQVFPKERPF